MPRCVPVSIHSPIIPILPSLLKQISLPSLGLSALFLSCLPHPLGIYPISIMWSFLPWPHVPYPSCNHLFTIGGCLTWHQLSCPSPKHHWCFPLGFIVSSFLPSYSICALSWCSAGFAYSFISINIWPFQCCNMTCFFVIPFLVFVLFSTRWWERSPRDSCSIMSIHAWQLGGIIGRTHN